MHSFPCSHGLMQAHKRSVVQSSVVLSGVYCASDVKQISGECLRASADMQLGN